jgi:hypothetical protein
MMRAMTKRAATGFALITMAGLLATSAPGQSTPPDHAARKPVSRQPATRRTPQPSRAVPDFLRQLMDSKSDLLSDLSWDLLSRIAMQLLSGNEAELLSGNKPEVLSGNKPEVLSGNELKLASENEIALLSGNQFSLFSNIEISIKISNSGNNNGNHGAAGAANAQFQALDRNRDDRVSRREYTAGFSNLKPRKARKRFRRLDQNGDFKLTAGEFNALKK